MTLLVLIVLFTALGGVLSVLAAGLFLLLPDRYRNRVLPHGISFATGALLAVSFWGLIPHAFEEVTPERFRSLSATILAGILIFFVLEKLLVWRHCHFTACEAHGEETHHHTHDDSHELVEHKHGLSRRHSAGALIIVGDSIHNFVDGILIAAAFLTEPKLGIVTSLAVAAHEIPQEVGDFAILLESGYNRTKAFVFNLLSSLATVVGGLLAYFSLGDWDRLQPYILALAASSFIYVAVADLIPTLHKKTDLKASLEQFALIAAGVALICITHDMAHRLNV